MSWVVGWEHQLAATLSRMQTFSSRSTHCCHRRHKPTHHRSWWHRCWRWTSQEPACISTRRWVCCRCRVLDLKWKFKNKFCYSNAKIAIVIISLACDVRKHLVYVVGTYFPNLIFSLMPLLPVFLFITLIVFDLFRLLVTTWSLQVFLTLPLTIFTSILAR